MSLEEYNILGIIGDSINSTTYKVENKLTKTLFLWYAIDCNKMTLDERQHFIKIVNERKSVTHPHFLKFHNYIEHKDSKILYVSTEFCKNGNLKDLIHRCNENREYIQEELIIRIIYQICFTFKTSRSSIQSLRLEDVFLDEDYKIKLLNFKYDDDIATNEIKMLDLQKMVFKLCTLKTDLGLSNNDFWNSGRYSKEFLVLLKMLSNDIDNLLNNCVDKILCHPTVLLKSSQWSKNKCYAKRKLIDKSLESKEATREDCQIFSQKLRAWEASLKTKEDKLKEKEYSLQIREKKIAIMERTVKEKLQQAELYLKRCRESKSISSGSSKSSWKTEKITYEDIDSTYSADCGDSVILPTSNKLNVETIIKPAPFTRTLSERKVRFKGHSPLKEVDYNRRKIKYPNINSNSTVKEYSLFENSVKCNLKIPKKITGQDLKISTTVPQKENTDINHKSKKLFDASKPRSKVDCNGIEYIKNGDSEVGVRPISWTEESKKQAFELLRAMNGAILDKRQSIGEIKHTYL